MAPRRTRSQRAIQASVGLRQGLRMSTRLLRCELARAHECHAGDEWQAACHALRSAAGRDGAHYRSTVPPASDAGPSCRDDMSSRRHGGAASGGGSLPRVPAGSILRACRHRGPLRARRGSGWRPTTFTEGAGSTGA
jgi:hypothetical protein